MVTVSPAPSANGTRESSQLWADKYKPHCIAQMCYPVCANKLKAWVEGFEPVGTGDPKKTRAVLLSGPPGVGKTTTVYAVAAELGMTVVEYNASDFRSRKSLRENVSDVVNNRTFSTGAGTYTRVILLMDEVDGCDVGGVGEVIEMIKMATVPIVCTCNDRWHQKLRSLINYVEDLRFTRPPCNIVATYLCDRVLAHEGIQLSKPLLQDIVKRSGGDIRSMLSNLQVWCLHRTSLEQRQLAECAVQSSKNGDASLFEAAEYFLLQGTSHGTRHSIEEMQVCYYNADLIDMFVQENYLHYNPAAEGRDWMDAVAHAASCISGSDRTQRMMYLEQNWSVSRIHVLLSSIAPCVYTRGKYESFLTGQQVFFDRQRPVKFPSWLGHNSTSTKNKRLLRCLAMQATNPRKGISGNQEDVALDYVPLGWEQPLTQPLCEKGKDGIPDVISVMDQYGIMRDDWDFINAFGHYKHMNSYPSTGASSGLVQDIPTAVKAAFTREFNKTHRLQSFTKSTLTHIDKGSFSPDEANEEEETTESLASGAVVAAASPTTRKRAAAKKPAPKSASKKAPAPSSKKPKGRRKRKQEESSEDSFVCDSDSD